MARKRYNDLCYKHRVWRSTTILFHHEVKLSHSTMFSCPNVDASTAVNTISIFCRLNFC